MNKSELLAYMRGHRLGVIGTVAGDGGPHGALVGIGVSDDCGIVFDMTTESRKHCNLLADPRIAVTLSGPGETTLQYEGRAVLLEARDGAELEAYYRVWPDGRARAAWPNIAYWRIVPEWARFSDYGAGGVSVSVFRFEAAIRLDDLNPPKGRPPMTA